LSPGEKAFSSVNLSGGLYDRPINKMTLKMLSEIECLFRKDKEILLDIAEVYGNRLERLNRRHECLRLLVSGISETLRVFEIADRNLTLYRVSDAIPLHDDWGYYRKPLFDGKFVELLKQLDRLSLETLASLQFLFLKFLEEDELKVREIVDATVESVADLWSEFSSKDKLELRQKLRDDGGDRAVQLFEKLLNRERSRSLDLC